MHKIEVWHPTFGFYVWWIILATQRLVTQAYNIFVTRIILPFVAGIVIIIIYPFLC